MSKILISGDVHGRFEELIQIQLGVLQANLDVKSCINCGDFGFYSDCFKRFNKMNITKFPIPLLVHGGNHEDYDWIKSQNTKEWEEKHNIFYKPRGTVEVIDGSTIAYMGGALNVDRKQEGSIDRRTTNYILNIEVQEALEIFNKLEKIDLLVLHSCPHSIGIGMIGSPIFTESIEKFCSSKGHSTGRITDCGDGSLKKLWQGLKVKPKNVVFGHFHEYKMKVIDDTTFYCIGSSDCSDNTSAKHPFIYDTQTKTIDWRNDITLLNYTGMIKKSM